MKNFIIIILLVLLFFPATSARAQDMRAQVLEANQKKEQVLKQANAMEARARQEARQAMENILTDKTALEAEIARLEKQNAALSNDVKNLENQNLALAGQERAIKKKLARMDVEQAQLAGLVRQGARDVSDLVAQSPQTALDPDRDAQIAPLTDASRFPSMDGIQALARLVLDEIQASGEVRIVNAPLVDRSGKETRGNVLVLGNFTAAYKANGETGFLLYSPQSRRLFALSKKPPRKMTNMLDQYMAGKSPSAPLDMSRGGALRQLVHTKTLWSRISGGGPIVWPILCIGLLGLLLVIERLIYFFRVHENPETLMAKIREGVRAKDWETVEGQCRKSNKKPLGRVLLAGVRFRGSSREDMENALQESILSEIPNMERFLSTLQMLAAIAPLLGLLGTVTGMIRTFDVITLYGAGDPRMMSGGISEALVTTMLGLAVAIPILLCQTLLSRRADSEIGLMEEKAVALVNLAHSRKKDP